MKTNCGWNNYVLKPFGKWSHGFFVRVAKCCTFSLSNCQLSSLLSAKGWDKMFLWQVCHRSRCWSAPKGTRSKDSESKSREIVKQQLFLVEKREILTLQRWIDFSIDGTEATRLDAIMWLACRLCSVMCGSQRESLIGVVLAKPDHQGASKQRSQRQFLWHCAFLVWAVDLKPFFVGYCS